MGAAASPFGENATSHADVGFPLPRILCQTFAVPKSCLRESGYAEHAACREIREHESRLSEHMFH
jgi:hypothetical protein